MRIFTIDRIHKKEENIPPIKEDFSNDKLPKGCLLNLSTDLECSFNIKTS